MAHNKDFTFNLDLSNTHKSQEDKQLILNHARNQIDKVANTYHKDFPEYMKAKILNVYPNNLFDLASLDETKLWYNVPSIIPGASQYLQPQQVVQCRFYSVDSSRPYIRNGMGISSSVLDVSAYAGDSGNIVVMMFPGLWVQSGAFWWNSWESLNSMEAFPLKPPTSTLVVNIAAGPPAPINTAPLHPGDVRYFQATSVYFPLVDLPVSLLYSNFTITSIKINGAHEYINYFVGPNQPINPDITTQINYLNATLFPPNNFLLNNFTDTSAFPTGPTFDPSAITSIEVDYQFDIFSQKTLQTRSGGVGFDTAISCRGLVAFPSTSGTSDQIVSVLTNDYVAADGTTTDTLQIEGDLNVGAGGYSFILSQVALLASLPVNLYGQNGNPWRFNTFPYNLFGLPTDQTFVCPYEFYSEGSSLFVVAGAVSARQTSIDVSYTTTIPEAAIPYTDTFSPDPITGILPPLVLTQPPSPSTIMIIVYQDGFRGNYDPLATLNVTNNLVTTSIYVVGSVVAYSISVDYTVNLGTAYTENFLINAGNTQKTVFNLARTPDPGSVTTPIQDLAGTIANGWNFNHYDAALGHDVSVGVVFHPIITGNAVRFAYVFPVATRLTGIQYKWKKPVGNRWKMIGFTITEYNLNNHSSITLVTPFAVDDIFDATPQSHFHSPDGTDSIDHSQTDGWRSRYGFLSYDPPSDSYTVVTPIGIFWRSRSIAQLIDFDYTFMPWPDEDVCADGFITGWDYPSVTKATGRQADSRTAYHTVYTTTPAGHVAGILTPLTKRRTAPWLNVSVASRYAYQGGWAPIGPGTYPRINVVTTAGRYIPCYYGNGAAGDSSYPVRFYQRDPKHHWQQVGFIEPLTLANDFNQALGQLYLPPSGATYAEVTNKFIEPGYDSFGNPSFELTNFSAGQNVGYVENSWASANTKIAGWVIPCGWCKSEWGKDISGFTSRETYAGNYPVGFGDAGLTLNLVSPQGKLLSHLTFKCDLTDIVMGTNEGPGTYMAYRAAHALDWLTQDAVFHLLSRSGGSGTDYPISAPVFRIDPYQSSASAWGFYFAGNNSYEPGHYHDYTGSQGFAFRYYAETTYDVAKVPKLLAPGIPTFCSDGLRLADTYGQLNASINTPSSSNVTINQHNNMYVCVAFPYRIRQQDSSIGSDYGEVVTGTTTQSFFDTLFVGQYTRGPNLVEIIAYGYKGSPIISRVLDEFNSPPATRWSTYNDAYVIPQPRDFRFFDNLHNYNWNDLILDGIASGPGTPYYNGPDGALSGYTFDVSGTAVITWTDVIPNRTYTSINHVYDVVNTGTYIFPYYHFMPSFGFGYGGGAGPFSVMNELQDTRAVIYNAIADNRATYAVNARDFLIKLNCEGTSLTEVWRKDISEMSYGSGFVSPGLVSSAMVPTHTTIYETRQVGRYIFLLRDIYVITTSHIYLSGTPVPYLCLQVWADSDTVPDGVSFSVPLPNPLPIPLVYETYHHSDFISMVHGIDSLGREWAAVKGVAQTTPLVTEQAWIILMPKPTSISAGSASSTGPTVYNGGSSSTISTSPGINGGSATSNSEPTVYYTNKSVPFPEKQGAVQASNTFIWMDNVGSVIYTTGG